MSVANLDAAEKPVYFPVLSLKNFLEYGWLTILIGALAMTATYPSRTHGLGMITEPLLTDLNLSDSAGRNLYSEFNLWGTLIGALFCIPIGWLFDRFDRRLVLAANLVLLGAATCWMSTIHSQTELLIAIIVTRGLGQAALSVVSITIVAKGFHVRQLGLAMAWYAILSTPFHVLLIQNVSAARAQGQDWRNIWFNIGLVLGSLSILSIFLSSRVLTDPETQKDISGEGATLKQALRSPAFWVISLTISLWGMISGGIALYNEDILKELGFDTKIYTDSLQVVTVVGLAFKLLFGYWSRRHSLGSLLGLSLLITAAALVCLPFATKAWHVYAYSVLMGIGGGAVALLFFAAWGKLYGHRELGKIQGVAQMLTVLLAAFGPLVFSKVKELTASYSLAFQFFGGVFLVMAIISWLTPMPKAEDYHSKS